MRPSQLRRPSPLPLAAWAALGLVFAMASAIAAPAAAQPGGRELEKASLTLTADAAPYTPGATAGVTAAVTIETGWHVNARQPTYDFLIPTELVLELPAGWGLGEVTYPEAELQRFAFADEPLAVYDGMVEIRAQVKVPADAPAGTFPVGATLRYQACDDRTCLPPTEAHARAELVVAAASAGAAAARGGAGTPAGGGDGATAGSATPASAAAETSPGDAADAGGAPEAPEDGAAAAPGAGAVVPRAAAGTGVILLLALVGGLILNAMPCVLPVLSLKVFGLVKSAGEGRGAVTRSALATAAGILISFWALAAAAVAARAAGAAAGWGVQFQRPGFVAFLAVVVVLFCLNLWGLFEITLPWRVVQAAGAGQQAREGMAGHFVTGLFATLMATPCSAPFLGTAVGFALGQPPATVVAVFTAIGLGMALPYLLLAVRPGIARFLPRPGEWMETLRGTMGFLLAGSAVWLLYVLASQVSPERLAAIELALLGLALLVWVWSRTAQGTGLRRAAATAVLAAAVAPVLLGAAAIGGAAPRRAAPAAGLIAWEPFDRARAEALAAQGTAVFVDVTAEWCFTCKVNERLVLETPEVAGVFAEHGIVPMKADWTTRDESVGRFLAEHGRYGIPFYLLYWPGREPHVFSELLTKDAVVEQVRASAGAPRVAERQ